MKIVGNKMYDVCPGCGKIIQVNKFLIGSLHICATREEQQEYSEAIKVLYEYQKKNLEDSK